MPFSVSGPKENEIAGGRKNSTAGVCHNFYPPRIIIEVQNLGDDKAEACSSMQKRL